VRSAAAWNAAHASARHAAARHATARHAAAAAAAVGHVTSWQQQRQQQQQQQQYPLAAQAGMVPVGPPPGEQRICFPFLNRGSCERGAACRFRHLPPDHPDAIADRMRNGGGRGQQPAQNGAAMGI